MTDQFNLREKFEFNASVSSATYDESAKRWHVVTDTGTQVHARFLIMATGCLSTTNTPDFPGLNNYEGDTYHTGNWPHEGVDFTGKKVAVIGTGSSAIQSIPLIAKQAGDLTVFQRTAGYTIPAHNGPLDPEHVRHIKENYSEYRARAAQAGPAFGAEYPRNLDSALDASPELLKERFDEFWGYGGFMFLGAFGDISMNRDANILAADYVRGKIRETVTDPEVAELLCPDTVLGCKRLCADNGYYATYNRDNVHLVDISQDPIDRLTAKGLVTGGVEYDFDAIVFATGFDAMTGSLFKANITGAGGVPLTEKWAAGPGTYLGLMTHGFPNLFMITAPGSPSALANLITGVEQHAEFITDLIEWSDERGHTTIDAEKAAEDKWVGVVNARAEQSLYPYCNSWYLGANVPGKPRVFMPYLGFPDYSKVLVSVVAKDYEGLQFG